MCFSAQASFIVGGTLALIGVSAVRRANNSPLIFVAFIPLLFALQQWAEGFLWIVLQDGYPPWALFWLPSLYGIFIGVIWPVYAPFAVYRAEADDHTKKIILPMLLVGLGLAGYTIIGLIDEPIVARIVNQSIYYDHDVEGQQLVLIMYLFATCVPFILSSDRWLNVAGGVIVLGFLVAFFAYRQTFASVWCFFAAAASALLYFYIANQVKNRQDREIR
ncbi:MAG: DUF6629 family protein [Nitrosomonas sp.]|nr:hypothetical protein [Nitrosomonas sp.]MCC7135249.1 hypothetical protein [Nitrosomonas sp.]